MSESTPHPGKPVRDPETYRQALDGWMSKHLSTARGLRVHDVDMPTATGFSNETVFFSATWDEAGESQTRKYVARIEPEDGGLFPEQTDATRVSVKLQHRIMSAVDRAGIAPLPPLLPYEGDLSVLGRPFFVMEFIPGEVPADVPRYTQAGFLVDDATPVQREQLVRSGIENMAALNRLDWRAAGLDWLDISGKGEPTFGMQLGLYREYVERELAGRPYPVMMQALDWLDANEPDAPIGLSWGDSRLGNMIWQDYRCAAVVDWEAAALAPVQCDIGWWVMFDRMSYDDMDTARLEGFPTREKMVKLWEELTGLDANPIHYWELFAVMRFAAIMIKLGDRFVRAGLAPPDSKTATENGVTEALARLLENSD